MVAPFIFIVQSSCRGIGHISCARSALCVQLPSLQSRCRHSATVFSLSPNLADVVIFGGYYKCSADVTPIANTTVLRFGECR